MRMRLALKLLLLLVLGIYFSLTFVLAPELAFAMPCCSALNCEGNYQWCVTRCAQNHPNDQACMDNCLTQARACARTHCSSCSGSFPCWFGVDDPEVMCGYPQSGQSCASNFYCAYPYVCLDGSCVQGGCNVTSECPSGFECSGGFCVQ